MHGNPFYVCRKIISGCANIPGHKYLVRLYQIDIMHFMHVISFKTLRVFFSIHPEAEGSMKAWHSIVERAEFSDFHDVRDVFNTASLFGRYTIFNVGGNKYRIITAVHYNAKRVYVRHVLTHSEYTKWCRR